MSLPTWTNPLLGPLTSPLPRSSSSVWIVDLMQSAGNRTTLYMTPAPAPAVMSSHALRSPLVTRPPSLSDTSPRATRRSINHRDRTSNVVNHAASPPVSRMRVPVWPSHRPRTPYSRRIERVTVSAPGIGAGAGRTNEGGMARAAGACAAPATACAADEAAKPSAAMFETCILHLTSSTGVRTNETAAPATAAAVAVCQIDIGAGLDGDEGCEGGYRCWRRAWVWL